jgi:hypothetical protein
LTHRLARIDEVFHRLIPSRFPPVDVYDRLGSPELSALAKTIEDQTNPRLRAKDELLAKPLEPGETSARLQNWNHAPFAYLNPEGTTFLDPGYGVLEVVRGVREALALAVRRRELFLARTDEPAMGLDMRLLVTPVKGEFVDLTDAPFEPDRKRRWDLGGRLYEDGAKGVLFRRPEQLRATALAIFDSRVLGPAVQSAHYRFVWDGGVISKVYDFTDGEEILRDVLLTGGAGLETAS